MNETRTRILTATNELFRRRGFHGTSLKDVVTAAPATTGSVYHFFPAGKSELAEAVLRETGETYRQLFELVAADAPTVAAGFAAFFDGAAAVLEETDFIDVCAIGTVAREVASTDEQLRRAAAAVFAGWIATAAERLVAAGVEPAAATDLATTVVAALEGAFVLARTARDADVVRRTGAHMSALVKQAIEQAVEHAAADAGAGTATTRRR